MVGLQLQVPRAKLRQLLAKAKNSPDVAADLFWLEAEAAARSSRAGPSALLPAPRPVPLALPPLPAQPTSRQVAERQPPASVRPGNNGKPHSLLACSTSQWEADH